MAQPTLPTRRSELLDLFGTPNLLWRVLSEVGYTERPVYRWLQSVSYEKPWYEVALSILAQIVAPFWERWDAQAEGHSPWEARQVAAFEVLRKVCYHHRDEIRATTMRLFPLVNLEDIGWCSRTIQFIRAQVQ